VSSELWETIVLKREPAETRVFQTGDVNRLVEEIEAL
jgi:hypothetical protein